MALGHPWHLDTRMGARLGIAGGSTLAAKFDHHNDRANRGSAACLGAGHSTGLRVWGAGWWLWQAAGVSSPWPSPNLCPKLAGQLWLSFLMSLWPSSFPIEPIGKLRLKQPVCREEPGVGGRSGRPRGWRSDGEGRFLQEMDGCHLFGFLILGEIPSLS